MDDVDRIVAGLSQRQREAITGATDMFSDHGGYPFFTVPFLACPWPEGVAQFITLHRDRLTPLGLAVRARLAEVQSHE